MIANIVGWVLLIASWVAPRLVSKDKQSQAVIGTILSSMAFGVFIGHYLSK